MLTISFAGYRGVRDARRIRCGVPHVRRDQSISWFMMDQPPNKPSARNVLRDWARAPGYSVRAAEFLELARCASAPNVRKRYTKIAQHYLTLAEAEKRAQLKKTKRGSRAVSRVDFRARRPRLPRSSCHGHSDVNSSDFPPGRRGQLAA
jgi:hypothetical protein